MRFGCLVRARLAWLGLGLGLVVPSSAAAQIEGAYNLDIAGGPVLRSTRITAMGGAHLALAEGVHGFSLNPAAAANPFTYNRTSDFDWDAVLEANRFETGGLDFNNDGETDPDFDVLSTTNLGATVTVGRWGFGAAVEVYRYGFTIETETAISKADLEARTVHLGAAGLLWGGQVLYGAAVRVGATEIETTRFVGEEGERIEVAHGSETFEGGALEAGVLWRPPDLPLRLGGTVRTPVEVEPDREHGLGDRDFSSPDKGVVPIELAVGAVYRFGPGVFNRPVPLPSDRAPSPGSDRGGMLVVADLVFTGPVDNALSAEGFIRQTEQRSGADWTVSPRVGAEAELWHNRLRIRGGHYYEPARIDGARARPHLTGGFELRLFDWEWLGVSPAWSTMFDVAPRYVNFTVAGVGFWH